jgi:site-specific DNA recombinase
MVRCAIYTRKSTDEGLNMEFNSLDAQREAAEAFIHSQRHEGWVVLPEKYDDGGFSGGNMDRPALQRLMAEVETGRVDAIVVYKVDRLSRSLLDFSRIMETLDRHGCSFVSVTQQFNTTHSMGRLTLNILLSFAQFEREIISERTRDKMGAARRRGKWTGGGIILGYDLDQEKRRLVINPTEATIVRDIFQSYLKARSILAVVEDLNERGIPRKSWTTKSGTATGGGPWTKSNLANLLTNHHYVGKVAYKGEIYPSEHEAIIDEETWTRTQALLTRNARAKGSAPRAKSAALLRGLLKCGCCGSKMIHTYTGKKQTRYRYYTCQKATKQGAKSCPTGSLPAAEIENFVVERITTIGNDESFVRSIVEKAASMAEEKRAVLDAERDHIEKSLRGQARSVASCVGQPNAFSRLADLESQIRAGENRLAEIVRELVSLDRMDITAADVATVMGGFREFFDRLSRGEAAEVVAALVEEVVYDQNKGTVAISFHPSGIKSLAEEKA